MGTEGLHEAREAPEAQGGPRNLEGLGRELGEHRGT